MRLLTLVALLFCSLVCSANAQSVVVQNTPPFTGTAIGSGYTFTGSGTLFAANIGAYNFNLPFSTSLWVQVPKLDNTKKYFLNGLNAALTSGFAVTENEPDVTADSLFLQNFLQPSVTNCNGSRRMCANRNLIGDGQLHHLCTVWTATGSAFYVDGTQWSWGTSGATMTPNTTAPWIIGQSVLSGTVEVDVASWTRALTPAECVTIYNRGKAGFSLLSGNAPTSLNDQLVSYWSLSNCTGTPPALVSCADGSVNNNTVTTDPAPSVAVTVNGVTDPTGVTGTATIAATCTDTYGVASVSFSVDGNSFFTNTTAPYTTTFNTLLLDDVTNPHTTTATCTNIGGVTASASTTLSTNNGTIPPATYFLSVSGSDSNNGTSSGTPWLSPNHNIRCGDTILAAPSQSYQDIEFFAGKWGTVWSCPTAVATTGIYFAFLKCNGSFVQDCFISTAVQGSGGMRLSADHWAVQGWTITQTAVATDCFAVTSPTPHYLLFLNDYAKGCTGGGFSLSDYGAIVGSLSYGNAFNGSSCFQGISSAIPLTTNNPSDTGTHAFIGGTFSINNHNQGGCSDGNGFIMDDQFINPAYNNQIVVEQSMFLGNGSLGIAGNGNAPASTNTKIVSQSTLWGNGLAMGSGRIGELELGSFSSGADPSSGWNFQNIIAVAIGGPAVCKFNRTAPFTCPAAGVFNGGFAADYAVNVAGSGNCIGAGKTCSISNSYIWDASGNNLFISDPAGAFVLTNVTNSNPGLAAPAQVLSPPDCSTSATVLACVASIRSNFTPSGGAAALGYQPPGACAPDPLYPVWLKGSVPDGLLTKPCGF